jgi:hypothetical protein
MGYFEAIANAYLKTGTDGRLLFYPWGALGRGYVIKAGSEAQLRGAIKAFVIASIIVGGAGYTLWREIGALIAGGVLIIGYVIAIRFMVRGLEASGERLRLREAYTAEARGFSKVWLWSSLAIMVAMFVLSTTMFIAEAELRLQAAGGIALFAALAAFSAWMIVLRQRTGQSQPPGAET